MKKYNTKKELLESNKKSRIGEISYNKFGKEMKIIKYNGCLDIVVEFDNGYVKNTTYNHFKNRNVANPYDKTICKLGYLGEGNYKTNTAKYETWKSMLKRCYDEKERNKNPSYKGCTVCEVWHNFQNFAKWYDENYYKIDNEKMNVDKDILHKGNKIYSPDNCLIVPERINTLFTKRDKSRGDFPIGVCLDSSANSINKYRASYGIFGKQVYIGMYLTAEMAFESYKIKKELHIKELANLYKNEIPIELYNALINWKVEITD